MKKKNMSLTTQMTIAIVLLILLANLILGFFMISQTIITMKAQISERMLDISNTAAATLNGDMLERLQAKDKYTFEYNGDVYHVYQVLAITTFNGYVFTYTAKEEKFASHFDTVKKIMDKVTY